MRRRFLQRRRRGFVWAWAAALGILCASFLPGVSLSAKTGRSPVASPGRADEMRDAAASIDPAAFSLELPTRDPAEALRRAIAVEDAMAGAERLAAVARDFEIIADHAMLLRADKLTQAQQHSEAAATAAAALERYDATPLRPDFYEVLGNARAQVGDEEGARDAWTRGIRATRDSDRQAALRLRVGESLERGGQLEDAAAIYRRIWSRHATSEQAEVAETRLDELEKQPGVTGRAADDWRRRADQLFRKRHNEAALGAYDQALAGKLKKSEAQRAQNQRAHTLFRMRRYPEAVRAFTALPQNDDVPLWRARSLARSGEVPKAVGEFEKLAKKSNGEL
ncbi:MAG: tetratricopeptide repeat protein, partial [bacterium]|nr:tetratricopeptide repeat protein [bacterium]